jgi:hypothetical protein
VQLTLGQPVQIQDRAGEVKTLHHDPKARKLLVKSEPSALSPAAPLPRPAPVQLSSIFCPACTAVLGLPIPGQVRTCPNCGHRDATEEL